jgi:hypothetical protein
VQASKAKEAMLHSTIKAYFEDAIEYQDMQDRVEAFVDEMVELEVKNEKTQQGSPYGVYGIREKVSHAQYFYYL